MHSNFTNIIPPGYSILDKTIYLTLNEIYLMIHKTKRFILESFRKNLKGPKCVLLIPSVSEHNIALFTKQKYSITYDPTIKEYTRANGQQVKLVIYSNLNRLSFDLNEFKAKCSEIRRNLSEIVLIENLNPRPETLENDLNIISRVFRSHELRSLLRICFTSSSKSLNLNEIKGDVLNFNVLFEDVMMMKNREDKVRFIENRIEVFDHVGHKKEEGVAAPSAGFKDALVGFYFGLMGMDLGNGIFYFKSRSGFFRDAFNFIDLADFYVDFCGLVDKYLYEIIFFKCLNEYLNVRN